MATKKIEAPESAVLHTTRDRFVQLRATLLAAFQEREHVVDALLAALIAGEHVVMLGPPGTGKSAIARAVCGAFGDARYFETLLTRYSEPSDLFGGVDLLKWQQTGIYERRSAGMLQESHIAFLTEVFKGNASVLNSVLPTMNERVFHDGGVRHAIPLRTLIGDSNEMPEAGELQAMWDRFIVRIHVDYVREEQAFAAVVTGADPTACTAGMGLTLADLDAAQTEAASLPLGPDVVPGLYALRGALGAEGIVVSDRRWKKLLGLLRAWAWLQGDAGVDALHFEILRHGLWSDPREVAKVTGIVTKTASPALNTAIETFDAIMEQINGLPQTGSIKSQGASVGAELKKAITSLETQQKTASTAVAGRIAPLVVTLREKHGALVKRITIELGL